MPIRRGDILAKRASDLTTRPLLPKHDCATTIEPNDVERVLTDISADYGNRALCCRSHWRALGFGAPGQLIAGGAGARPDHPITGHAADRSFIPGDFWEGDIVRVASRRASFVPRFVRRGRAKIDFFDVGQRGFRSSRRTSSTNAKLTLPGLA